MRWVRRSPANYFAFSEYCITITSHFHIHSPSTKTQFFFQDKKLPQHNPSTITSRQFQNMTPIFNITTSHHSCKHHHKSSPESQPLLQHCKPSQNLFPSPIHDHIPGKAVPNRFSLVFTPQKPESHTCRKYYCQSLQAPTNTRVAFVLVDRRLRQN